MIAAEWAVLAPMLCVFLAFHYCMNLWFAKRAVRQEESTAVEAHPSPRASPPEHPSATDSPSKPPSPHRSTTTRSMTRSFPDHLTRVLQIIPKHPDQRLRQALRGKPRVMKTRRGQSMSAMLSLRAVIRRLPMQAPCLASPSHRRPCHPPLPIATSPRQGRVACRRCRRTLGRRNTGRQAMARLKSGRARGMSSNRD